MISVIFLTFYNILPTIFYYAKPLKEPIYKKQAFKVADSIVSRVNELESFTVSWLRAQSKNLGLKPVKIVLDSDDPKLATVSFKTPQDAQLFAQTLFRAGSLIPFVPAQLSPDARSFGNEQTDVIVQRKIGIHLDPKQLDTYFTYVPKEIDGEISKPYHALASNRVEQIALGFGGVSQPAQTLKEINDTSDEAILRLARTITEYDNTFGDTSAITRRYFSSFGQGKGSVHSLIGRFEQLSQKYHREIGKLNENKPQGGFLNSVEQQRLEVFTSQKNVLDAATTIVRRNASLFESGTKPLTSSDVMAVLNAPIPETKVQTIDVGTSNPFVSQVEIDWNRDEVEIVLHPDVVAIRENEATSEAHAIQLEKLNQLLFNEIATVARSSDENITPSVGGFTVSFNTLTNSSSLLALDLGVIAQEQARTLAHLIDSSWSPTSVELTRQDYPIHEWASFKGLPTKERKFGLVIFAPSMEMETYEGFRPGSLYVVAKGLNTIRAKYADLPDSPEKVTFEQDFSALQELMRQNGFISYPGSSATFSGHEESYIFELDDYYSYLLAATREDFNVKGNKRFALLEFTDVEQRLLTLNKIETRGQEDLVKWQDEYRQAKVALDERTKYEVPPPTKNVLLSNLKLSAKKYFRGDERKVLKWGLDLSGGKTVRIGLKDQNDQPITNEADLKQASNELYQRVNRLGVSEVGIRTEGSNIVLDFPGSQGLSANELIQASAMYFNVVNEKFSPQNPMLSEAVNTFLEEVWNEAVITNRTDPSSINEIAWQHLGGNPDNPDEFHPLSSHARLLYEHGLRFAGPKSPPRGSGFDETLSAVALFRGTDFADWQGQTYPLLITFRNYALEGANLTDVQAGYDSQQGNVLHFSVRGSYVNHTGQKISPRDTFYAWTSQFAEDKIGGTPKESYSKGRGWRMAVILNGTIINAPTLNSALRDSARITGNFTQREVNQLTADLKAGSLSFTPYILSEENVSPDLGKDQRMQGIFAGLLAIALVFVVMCSYYRFSGLVASVAVLFNLLIIWAVLQNLDAAMTLPGIAGIILALGMAVDANVLVFERIREEFNISGRLPSAIATGYRKAYSAIVDSNLTTIIAALILLNFDSGPIKGFALTLIIGIISSMFTSLFMTRFFFAGWVQNPNHKELKMSRFFGKTKINFLKKAKVAIISSLILIVAGCFFFAKERSTIFGMDFTGGYSLTLDLQERGETNYRLAAESALVQAGAAPSDFQIQELNKPTQLRLQLGTSMQQPGKPFANLDGVKLPDHPLFAYQTYPRIVWIVDALEQSGLQINPASLPDLNLHWTEMSGQLSATMRNQALLGLGLALLCILIYITFRFEFKYAISATIALGHDLLITLGILAVLHLFFEGIRIDLQVIGALMTIVGYSLNDTIIIFDRIREELRIMRKQTFSEIINHALNVTLGRTMMTSGTTLVVLLALVIFGGGSIINFALVMTIGVAVGTFSSLFIASPILLYFHKRAELREEKSSLSKKV
ncbi:MAG: Protein translocase subunit SecD [Chlamydiales bacterium]|nr:Protein translocase subunit SecD [Chlamydiales bacterium]MCH9619337.1 Protein translocase subunit SecD [Chlamydiales bacterium]MCH9622141.1 Protein translocase subunit SecD [Chlamydiales bacterium]